MSQGVHVFGSSSMGALRASELSRFGMCGVGAIFEDFYNGVLEDDDEVTVLHGPQELGYPNISEAMVNIRATLAKALQQDIISLRFYEYGVTFFKELHYKERSYQKLIQAKHTADECVKSEQIRFSQWVAENARDLKKEDAIKLLYLIKDVSGHKFVAHHPNYNFQDTIYWQSMKTTIEMHTSHMKGEVK